MTRECPCRTCAERKIGCHGDCIRYAKYRAVMDHILELQHEAGKVETLENGWYDRHMHKKERRKR